MGTRHRQNQSRTWVNQLFFSLGFFGISVARATGMLCIKHNTKRGTEGEDEKFGI